MSVTRVWRRRRLVWAEISRRRFLKDAGSEGGAGFCASSMHIWMVETGQRQLGKD